MAIQINITVIPNRIPRIKKRKRDMPKIRLLNPYLGN